MYLGELCKPNVPCKLRRPSGTKITWDGNRFRGFLGDRDYVSADWELAMSKVIDWPEGTWGYEDNGVYPVYRANEDYGIVFLTHGPYVLKLNNYLGTIDPKAKEEVMV